MRIYWLRMYIKYLLKNKLYTFITFFGFAISLTFVLLLSVYIKDELSVDQFHSKKDRIYRLTRDSYATFGSLIGDNIKSQYPEVESYTRIFPDIMNAKFKDKQQVQLAFMLADSSFFNIFSFKLRTGDPSQVLATKNSAVLSSSFAFRMFGTENPVGKTFLINKVDFIISGIFEDIPSNSHFNNCDAILNFNILGDLWYKEILETNDASSFGLYFLAKKGTDLPSKAPQILTQFKKDYWLFSSSFSKTLEFEPLEEVYFSKISFFSFRQNSRTTIFIFVTITLLILLIAIINYINLTVALSGLRAKEMAIKKMMGSSKLALIVQHISESVTLILLASVVAVNLAFVIEPFFNNQMNCQLNLNRQFTLPIILIMIGIIIMTGFISGIIPAILVNKFNPLEVVKGNFARKSKSQFSKVLISFQYIIAIGLLICTTTIVRQSVFMQNFDLGFNKDNLFWMENTIEATQKTAFRNILKSIPGVVEVSYCRGTPLSGGNNQSFNYNGKPVSFQEFLVDSSFIKILGMKVKSTDAAFSKDGVWINRTAIKTLELGDNPVTTTFYDHQLPVLGIIEDFNFRSLHSKIGPIIIRQLKDDEYPWDILVKIDGSNPVATASDIRKTQAAFTAGVPMKYGFVEDGINQMYIKEIKQSRLIGSFTILSLIIASMGIFAMALYYLQQKVKEIGIRKINGAKIIEIMVMLNKNFIVWVLIAFIIACPIAFYAMTTWLQNFAYHTNLSWWIFAMSGLFAVSIALLTVSWQSWRASTRNPVEALRYE
jgi:putative ABC transport system permease protein